jgi:ubiquinone/menaquinone biosynthesis C-methylase UbiE
MPRKGEVSGHPEAATPFGAKRKRARGSSTGRRLLLCSERDSVVATESSVYVMDVFSRAAGTYDSVGPRHFTYFARELVEFAGVEPGSRVLDVATGTGAVLLAAAERAGGSGRLVGIDLTAAMLERAASEVRRRSLSGVELQLMDAHQLDFANNSFDYVLCSFAFLSLREKELALEEFARVLAPGGWVCLLDAYGWFFQHDPRWAWQEDVLRSFGALPERDARTYGPGYLEGALETCGLDAVSASEQCCELLFRDEEELWRWMWSHGSRGLLEAVPQHRLEELRKALFRGLAACTEADGMIHGTLRAVLARGRKAH